MEMRRKSAARREDSEVRILLCAGLSGCPIGEYFLLGGARLHNLSITTRPLYVDALPAVAMHKSV